MANVCIGKHPRIGILDFNMTVVTQCVKYKHFYNHLNPENLKIHNDNKMYSYRMDKVLEYDRWYR